MKLPQREITACLFHSERKQKSKEMGPRRERGEQRPAGPSPQRLPGVWRWILLRWILHREKAGPDWGLLSSSGSGFLVRGSALGKALPPTTVALLLSNQTSKRKKKSLQGIPGQRQRTRREWGDGYRNYLSRRVWPQLDFQAVKAPSFSTVLHPGPGTQRAQQETWEVES